MLFYVLVFVPSLLGPAEGSFTPEDRQKGVRLAAAWRLVDATLSENVRDRRMAHWDSRSRLYFGGDKDGDEAGQISYPSILKEPSTLRLVPSIANRLRSTGSNLEVTRVTRVRNEDTWKPDYAIDAFGPVRSDPRMLVLTDKGHRLRVSSDVTPGIKGIAAARCPRRTFQDQMIQEPVSVEEPGWILIDLTPDNVRDEYSQEDPFYVARGKRPFRMDRETKEDGEAKSEIFLDEDVPERSARKNAFVESLRRYLLGGEQSSLVSSRLMERDDEDEPVSPRNKHSDLFDILNEPFFISRGKKTFTGKNDFHPSNNGYSRARLNFSILRAARASREPKDAIDCSPFLQTRTNRPTNQSFRNCPDIAHRIVFSKRTYPFYVERGKRSINYGEQFKVTSDLEFTKITDNH